MWTQIDKFRQKLKVLDTKLEMWIDIDKDGEKFMEGRQKY